MNHCRFGDFVHEAEEVRGSPEFSGDFLGPGELGHLHIRELGQERAEVEPEKNSTSSIQSLDLN